MYPLAPYRSSNKVGTFIQARGDGIQYMYSEFAVGFSMFGSPPKGLITFNVMEPTQKRYWLRGHDLDAGMVWVFPVGGELRSLSAPGFQVHTISVPDESVEQVASVLELDLPPASKRPEVFSVPPEVLRRVRIHLHRMSVRSKVFPVDLVGEVLRLLIPWWLGPNTAFNRKRPSMRARDIALGKCLALIENYDLSKLSQNILLREANVSERTLQYAFRDRFGTSPVAFVKSRRLANARAALRRAAPGENTVGDVAADNGFWHLGQFSMDYRIAFGERPSETLQRVPVIR